MNNRICPKCETVNEGEYKYCKNCGTQLLNEEPKVSQGNNSYSQITYGDNPNQSGFYTESIDGIPLEQISIYVGKKASYYCPRFSKMEILKSKTSWNFSPALLGLVFGPLGAAIWCFFRKMYKAAFILVAIGMVFTAINTALTYDLISKTVTEIMDIGSAESVEQALGSLEDFAAEQTPMTTLADTINEISCIATAIIMGLFANLFYKNHCISSIKKYRESGLDQRYYKLGLASIGGTSGGMVAVGILIMIAVENLATSIVVFMNMF